MENVNVCASLECFQVLILAQQNAGLELPVPAAEQGDEDRGASSLAAVSVLLYMGGGGKRATA